VNVCAVVPVYDHGTPLQRTVDRLCVHGLPIIIVDDGSNEETKRAIATAAQRCGAEVVTLPRNGGKGCAVKAGLRAAWGRGYTHAMQVDADGQHDIDDVPKLLAAARDQPDAVVCGDPQFDASVPASRLYGRRLTSFWVRVETLSPSMPDTMCGFRVYPLAACIALLDSVRLGDRMDFDIEILVRLYWRGVPFVTVPTVVVYPEGGTSNFRLLRDNWLITKLHTRLVFGMLGRWPALLRRRDRKKSSHWATLGERGAVVGMRLLLAVYRVFGRWAFGLLLYPVTAYFYLTAAGARRASREYLGRVRARLEERGAAFPARLDTFHHLLEFGNAVLDKGAMWAGAFPPDRVAFDDAAVLERFRSASRGSLLIGSHLGNLEALRAYGETVQGLIVNALVFTAHSPKFNRVLAAANPQALERMIQVSSIGPETVIALQEKIRAGEHIAIVADRVSVRHRERSVHVPFLGRPAPFPEGPFVLASLLDCPVYLLFCLRTGGGYRAFLEPFADPLELPVGGRRAALERTIERYAQRLEAHCLMAPKQWFNFFQFWDQVEHEKPTTGCRPNTAPGTQSKQRSR
jgi:predicted LPLAT superfamily acyltransferase